MDIMHLIEEAFPERPLVPQGAGRKQVGQLLQLERPSGSGLRQRFGSPCGRSGHFRVASGVYTW